MKKLSLILLAFACTFLSCKKSNDSYYFRCHIDGAARTFNVGTYAHKEIENGITAYLTGGFATSSTSGDWIGIYIDNSSSSDDITTGVYEDSSPDFIVLGTFTDATATIDYESGTSMYEDAITYGHTITNHLKVTIQSIDGNTMKGTFSGDFYPDGNLNGTKKSITNGEFYLKWK
jgi:hypothetical protein